jgi:hypothetical protein
MQVVFAVRWSKSLDITRLAMISMTVKYSRIKQLFSKCTSFRFFSLQAPQNASHVRDAGSDLNLPECCRGRGEIRHATIFHMLGEWWEATTPHPTTKLPAVFWLWQDNRVSFSFICLLLLQLSGIRPYGHFKFRTNSKPMNIFKQLVGLLKRKTSERPTKCKITQKNECIYTYIHLCSGQDSNPRAPISAGPRLPFFSACGQNDRHI